MFATALIFVFCPLLLACNVFPVLLTEYFVYLLCVYGALAFIIILSLSSSDRIHKP